MKWKKRRVLYGSKRPDFNVRIYDGGWDFTWHNGTGVAEISSLARGQQVPWRRLWSDACDVGFYIRSHRTETVLLFTMVRENRKDGEIVGWDCESIVPIDGRKVQVFIQND